MKPSSGFTLVEMMISVAILAILLGVAVPGFQSFIQNTKIRTTADNMQAGLNLARAEALRRNARMSFWLVSDVSASCARSASGTSWVVSFDNPAGTCNSASSDTSVPRIVQTRSGSDGGTGISITATDGNNTASSCITFNGFGTVEAACTGGGAPIARLAITSTNSASTTRTLQVRVTSGGAVRMCDPSVISDTDPSYCGS